MNVISYPQTTNALIVATDQITGNCFFWSNDYTRLNVVAQGAGSNAPFSNPNTNFLISFPIVAGTNDAQLNSAGLVKAPMAAFGTLTAEAGIISNVTILAAPSLSITGAEVVGGVTVRGDSSQGLSATQASELVDEAGNWRINTINGQFIVSETYNNLMTLGTSGAPQYGANFYVEINAYRGVSNAPIFQGLANSALNVSNVLATNVTTQSNVFTAAASSSGQIAIYNYFPSSELSPTNCAYDWRSGPCYMESSLTGYVIATNSWLYTAGAGTNEVVAVTFSVDTAYTPGSAGQSAFALPATAVFANGPTRSGVLNAPASVGGAPASRFAAVAGLTGWSIWATNGSASAGRTVAWGHAENQ